MSYGANNVELNRDTPLFDVGINNNVVIKTVAFENAKKDGTSDKTVIRITFEGELGQTYTHTEFPVTDNDEKKIISQMKRLKRIVKEVTGNEFQTNFNSWEDCATSFIRSLGNYATTKLQIKLLYNDKGYLEMPKYDPTVKNMKEPTLSISKSEEPKLIKSVNASSEAEITASNADLDF
jgi:hypothetical protein